MCREYLHLPRVAQQRIFAWRPSWQAFVVSAELCSLRRAQLHKDPAALNLGGG